MNYWVITDNEKNGYDFHRVDAANMDDAVKQVNKGLVVVSSTWKKLYNKYEKLWHKLRDIEPQYLDIWDLPDADKYELDVIATKNMVEYYGYEKALPVYSLSDYYFHLLVQWMELIYNYAKDEE